MRQPLRLEAPERRVRRGSSGHLSAGFFDPVHGATVQVLGSAGRTYLANLPAAERRALPARLRRRGLRVLIRDVHGRVDAAMWERAGVHCLGSALPAHEIVLGLRQALDDLQSRRTWVHGVLLRVYGVGVLLAGPSGIGKSELALDLLSRGHVLIADDAVELRRPGPGVLIGTCPPVARGYLEVRGLGILDVAGMYGAAALSERTRVDLVIRLTRGPARLTAGARLGGRRSVQRILGAPLPVRSLAARLGDNRSVLVEAACLDHALRQAGVEADAALVARQLKAIGQNPS